MKHLVSTLVFTWVALSFTTLFAQTYTVRGTVMSAENPPKPVAGATIAAQPGRAEANTDSLGRFQLSGMANNTYTLEISASGYSTINVSTTVKGADQRMYVALPRAQVRGFDFIGTVTSQNPNGTTTPLGGASVSLYPGNYSTKSNASGEFRFESLPEGAYTVTIRAPAHEDVTSIFELKSNRTMQITLVGK